MTAHKMAACSNAKCAPHGARLCVRKDKRMFLTSPNGRTAFVRIHQGGATRMVAISTDQQPGTNHMQILEVEY